MRKRILKIGIVFIVIILFIMLQKVYALDNPGDAERRFKQTYGELYDDVYKKADLKSYYTFLGQMQGDSKVAFNASDYITKKEIYCVNYGKDYPYQAQRDAENAKAKLDSARAAYDKTEKDGQPSGMPSTAYNELLKNKKLDWYVADANYVIANNMSQSLMYKMNIENVDTSTETDSKKLAVAYALAHNARKGKTEYSSVQEYIDDEEGAGDENQRTIWSCFGYGSFTTEESVTAKSYAKDIAILNGETKTINVNGKIKGNEVISDNFSSPINFSADYLTPKIITQGASLNNPSDFSNIDKDTQMSVKINAVQGKKEYEIEIEVDYETYIVNYMYYEQGVMYKDKSRSELQDLLRITTHEEKSKKCKIKIIIKVDDTSIDIILNKVWNGTFSNGEVRTMTFQLYANGEKVTKDAKGNTIKNPISTKTTYTWKNLPKEDENGNDIEYTIKEFLNSSKAQSNEEFKEGTYNKQKIKFVSNSGGIKGESGTITITNEVEGGPPTEIIVTKKWNKPSSYTGTPPTVTINLLKDGVKIDSVQLSNGQSHTFKDLESGHEYSVQEESGSKTTEKIGKTTYTYTYDTSEKKGTNITITNTITGEDEPEPGEGDEVKITKTVEYVLSEYEGDTSSQDGAGNGSKEARVQTGDQVVFKIVVESLREDEPEDKENGEAGNWEDNEESTYGISGKPKEGNIQYCNISCHEGEKRTSWEEYAYKDSGNCAECGNPLGVRQVKSYGFKSLKLEDVLEDESKVKIKSIFDGTYDHGSVSGFTKPEGTWSMSGNTFTWDSGIGDEESGKKSATLYILCDVSEDWKYDDGKGNECVNTATLKHVDWRITKTRWYHWQQETTPFTSNHVQTNPHYHYKYVTCTTCRGSGSVSTWQTCQYCYGVGYIRYGNDIYTCWQCGGKGGSNSSQTCSNCGGSGQVRVIERTDTLCKGESAKKGSTTKKCNKTSLPTKYEDEGKDYDISDTAKVILQGYKESVEKKLTKIQSKYETEITGDDLKDELVQIGDVLTYTIRIKNEGETNIYTEFELEDELIEGLDTDDSKVDNSIWNGSDPTYTTTSVDGKNDSVQNGGRYIGNGEESEDVLFMAHVIGEPGERTENHVQLNYFHNRNKVKIESDAEATAENDIDTYSISVNKYITKVQSRQENSVAGSDGSGLVDLGDSRKTNKGEAVIVDRGDIVTFKIEITDDHDNTNIWKVVLKDVYNPEELALKEYRSEDNLFEVNGSGGNIELIYNNNPKDEPNTNNPHLEAGGGVRSVELDFVAIEGAEILKKDDIYENKVNIEEAYNRNHIEILQYSSTGGTHESSDKCKVRQINAVIDKYVSKVYGGIEDVVYDNEFRKREADTLDVYTINEEYKKNNNVPVERGDEITYTLKIRNTGEGIITVMKLEDVFDKELIFNKFIGENGWTCDNTVTGYNENQNKLNIEYNGLLNPGDEATLKLIFVMTNEEDDKYDLYGRNYINTLTTTEIQNINSWTWNNNGGPNTPYTSVIDNYNKNQCYLNLLQNGEDGIPSNMSSSDYVYMLEYKVELDKYVINVKHTNDDGSEENYNNPGRKHYENGNVKDYDNVVSWEEKNGEDTNRENWNDATKIAKGINKETYPVQVEKNDIVTYEIKIKNTNDESIPGETSIYALDIVDIFSSEDGTSITDNNIGLELLVDETNKENNNQLQIEAISNDKNQHLFKFTPKEQCYNSGKFTEGYGIGVGEEATFRIVVKVTRSNMYLYELRNTAVITNVYNRNNNIGNEGQDKYKYNSTDTGRSIEDAYRVTNGNRAYRLKDGSIVEEVTLNGLSSINGITVANKIADADYINLKDLIISGYVWDDTDAKNEEDGLMTWGVDGSTDAQVDGDVWAYLYRVEPNSVENYPNSSSLVMKTKIDSNGYYIFGTEDTDVYNEDNNYRVTVNQKYRFEPTNYKTPKIKVNGTETKDTQTKEIYKDNFTNYRIVKAPNKDYNQDGSTTRYWINEYKGYYQYYVEFEYNGMKYTHTVYGSDSVLNGAKGNAGNTSNQDGQYNLVTNERATKVSEQWLPYRTSTKDNSEYYEIDSNAAEFKSVREAFNNQFETVAVNKGIDPNGNETEIEYEKTGHTSQYKYNDNVKIRARSFVTNWIDIDNVTPSIKDNSKTYSATVGNSTNTLFFWDSNNKTKNYKNTVGTTEETEYLKYINLGLKQRPTLDLELTKDVYNVQVDINEKTMVYEYNCGIPTDRANNMDKDEAYYTTGYKLYLYKSDYYYRYTDYSNETVRNYKKGIEPENSELNPSVIAAENEGEWLKSLGLNLDDEKSESELNIQITYKYTITNKSGMPVNNRNELILGSINEIVDYHNADLIPNQTGRFVKNVNIQDVNEKEYNKASKSNGAQSGTVNVSTVYGNKNGNKNGYQTINGDTATKNVDKNEKFHTVYLSGFDDVKLYPEDSLDIYLTFTVSRTATEYNDIGKAISLETKYNIAEISAFSSWYDTNFTTEWSKNLKTPGLVDKDSNPGNEEIGNIMDASQYEDDTYRVDITPELYGGSKGNNGERLIDGLVWEDVKYNYKGVYDSQVAKTINETMQVVSDGIYKGTRTKTVEGSNEELPVDKDQLIGNVKVELIEMIQIKDKVYEDRALIAKDNIGQVETKTSDVDANKGRYELYGYIPGNYVVRFTYGDSCETIDNGYNGQDYKSTTYQVNEEESLNKKYSNVTYDVNKTDGYITNIWHDLLSSKINGMEITGVKEYDADNNPVQKVIAHVSDARDDEVRRLEVSAYSRTINNKVAEVLNSATNLSENESNEVKALHDELASNTWMFADTAKLQVEIEHLINVDEYKKQFIDMSKLDGENIQKLESYRIKEQATRGNSINDSIENKKHSYYIGNIDFGLEARPTTNISLTKLVSGIRVETADGEEILDVEYEPQYSENGTLLLNDKGVPTVDNTVTTGAEHMQALNSSTTDMWNKENMTNEEKTPDALKQIYRSLKTTQGFYYINIDEDLMQGAVITLRYSIVVANESEVDTLGMLTGYKTGEDIYDEVANIFEDKDTQYQYLNTKANNNLPTYNTDKEIEENVHGLKYGYFSGATYYTGAYHTDTYVVETRIDQIIDYVDNNLNVREEDNSTKDSSWRTVSLKELVEGDIQKDIVGQNSDTNTYKKDITLKYVPYEYASKNESTKLISVSNVGNMLADEVYRIKDLGTNNLGEIETKIPNAKANGEIVVDSTGVIKDNDGNEMTIMDSIGREYITEQRNNILLSIPETDKNPDLYKYLIPAKALTAKPNVNNGQAKAIEIKIDQITDEKINNENTSNEVKDAIKELKNNFSNSTFSKNLEGLKNYIDAYIVDDNFNGDEKVYEIAEGKLLKLAQETIASELSQYVYGTLNGSKLLENNKYDKINGDTSAKIKITATRTISPESTSDERDDLTFENLAEILQFSNEAGRRDEFATVGDAQVWEGAWQASTGMTPQGGDPEVGSFGNEESGQYNNNNQTSNNEAKTVTRTKERYDTDTTEMVLLSPPTGLSQRELVELGTVKTQNNILLISVLTLTMLGTIIVVIKISNRTKFYR